MWPDHGSGSESQGVAGPLVLGCGWARLAGLAVWNSPKGPFCLEIKFIESPLRGKKGDQRTRLGVRMMAHQHEKPRSVP